MKIVKMLLAVLICAALFGVAGAEPYDRADLVGTWSPEYMSIAMFCTINEDNTFDVQILEDLPIDIDGFSGTWTFDGISDVTFTHGDQSMTFVWDGKTLNGSLGGLPVVLKRDWQPEAAATEAPSGEAGDSDATPYYGTTDAPSDDYGASVSTP